ncbi:hypothetical protein F5878DRAFT_70610 [Lentinula raphanica]|uniref:Uncharacterized protein n=1 Tax=Lentinula raphanica TaxID=153919 RepID=A0AA38PCJ0_9AGAR|nr:hypothetical protein F5878DRAFT_70610 [Lentinula raphanica]
MQFNANGVNIEEEDSLFGSPPASPRSGRSPSPALALPSRSESIVNLQNVGTIALPGSHCNSKLPIDTIALPLSHSDQGISPSLAQSQTDVGHPGSHSPSSQPSTPSTSRATSRGPVPVRTKTNKRRREHESHTHSVRLPPPEIPLPDPTAPPPPNWLRSQSALLGNAGLVSGITPSTLRSRYPRGSTVKNPIVIDDEGRDIRIKCTHDRSKPTPRYHLPVNSSLPTPSIQEIAQILIKQREIFPVLHDISKLLQKRPTDHINHRPSPGPVFKKRKLNKVPAGAVDWDVPYPFSPGEGPSAYTSTWEQTREKQLVSQLVSLIKAASRKAAIRKYLEQQQSSKLQSSQDQPGPSCLKECDPVMPKVDGDQTLEAILHGLPNIPLQEILADASNNPVKFNDSSTETSPAPESSSFDEFLASLIATSKSEDSDEAATNTDLNSLFTGTHSQEITPELDQAVIDNCLSLFQTYQVPYAHEQTATQFSEFSSSVPYFSEAPSNLHLPLDIGSWNGASEMPLSLSLPNSTIDCSPSTSLPMDIDQTFDYRSTDLLTSTDVSHLGLSVQPNPAENTHTLIHPSLSFQNSFGNAKLMLPMQSTAVDGLVTPNSTRRTIEEPTLFSSNSTMIEATVAGHGRPASPGMVDLPTGIERPALDYLLNPNNTLLQGSDTQSTQENLLSFPTILSLSSFPSDVESPSAPTGTSSVFNPPHVRPYNSSSRTIEKNELLKRARDRRAQLAEEVLKTRMQLWETTIEHGVLTRLAKLYT